MHSILKNVLNVDDIAHVKALLSTEAFIDGRATSVLASKRNLQLPLDSQVGRAAGAFIAARLRAHDMFNLAVQPLVMHTPLFSRYDEGMQYPDHVDVAIMGGIRTDVAITLFLNELDSYEGGDLVVDTGNGVRRYRLAAGDAIAYPANTVHHVARVERGQRLAAVLWVQSRVRDPVKRQILLDLSLSARALEETATGPRINRAYWNLVRQWADAAPGGE